MNVVKATRRYEEWLGHRTNLVKKDLQLKHANMKLAVFPFLRATFYRWAQLWPEICPELSTAPQVLAVGDLHVENFGTWRDIEGRLVWGVNDFDEAHPLAYTNDLVRLAVSAHLASLVGHLPLKHKDICDALVEGYREGIREGGCAFVLGESNRWLREIAESELRDPVHFWARMDALPTVRMDVPKSAIKAIERLMPARDVPFRVAHRVAGLGSLGRQRYVAIAEWHGGQIAREAKAMLASACDWARSAGKKKKDRHGSSQILYQKIITQAVRCPDPFVQLCGKWIVRRLGPHCSRIELATLKAQGEELRLLHAMGWETANIHLGTKSARKAILGHLRKQHSHWLHHATQEMAKPVTEDWSVWKRDGYL